MNNFWLHFCQPLLQGLKITADPRVQQLGITLGGLNFGILKHVFRNHFYRHIDGHALPRVGNVTVTCGMSAFW